MAPVVHFLVLGSLWFVINPWRTSPAGDRENAGTRIVLTAADLQQLCRDWTLQYGTTPSAAQTRALVENAVDDEVLLREAFAAGLDRGDPVVRDRLVTLGRSLALAKADDAAALERAARALGLQRSDTLIQRYLTSMMRLAVTKLSPDALPATGDVADYYTQHADQFRDPPRLRFTHVYVSVERHGSAADAVARQLLDTLQHNSVDPQDAPARGDSFIQGPDVPAASPSDLERTFGPEFAAAIAAVPPHIWSGPLRSSYGLHLVWVSERIPAQTRPLHAVRNQVLHALLTARSAERLRTQKRALRNRYHITLPPLDSIDLAACQAAPRG